MRSMMAIRPKRSLVDRCIRVHPAIAEGLYSLRGTGWRGLIKWGNCT